MATWIENTYDCRRQRLDLAMDGIGECCLEMKSAALCDICQAQLDSLSNKFKRSCTKLAAATTASTTTCRKSAACSGGIAFTFPTCSRCKAYCGVDWPTFRGSASGLGTTPNTSGQRAFIEEDNDGRKKYIEN